MNKWKLNRAGSPETGIKNGSHVQTIARVQYKVKIIRRGGSVRIFNKSILFTELSGRPESGRGRWLIQVTAAPT